MISAGVMMANIIWKAKKMIGGIVRKSRPGRLFTSAPSASVTLMSFMNAKSKFPTNRPLSPKARENPTTAHRMPMRPMAKKFCMSMPSTFFPRTMPP